MFNSKVANLEGHDIYAIVKIVFYCISSRKFDQIDELEQDIVHPCAGIVKLLSSGSFYYSSTFDLTKDLRRRKSNASVDQDLSYLWNKSILAPLLQAGKDADLNGSILVSIIQGFIGFESVAVSMVNWKIVIISRLSSNRAGTRFNARGIDDDGNVSNFVETEFLIYNGNTIVSFLQLRGSVPLFFEQTGVQVSHKIKISRGSEITSHATRKHFEELTRTYSKIQIVNLLSKANTSPEFLLSEAYRESLVPLTEFHDNLKYKAFDFHAIVGRDNYDRLDELSADIKNVMSDFGYCLYKDGLIKTQLGVIRTNCLDCLDRTNVVQTLFANLHLQAYLSPMRITTFDRQNLIAAFNNLFADNGDWLSRIYAGTGALKSSYTRNAKQTLFGFLDDAAKSVNRFYVQTFQDKGRQEAIDLLLGNGTKSVQGLPFKVSNLILYCGTYNFNGKTPQNESLLDWISSRRVSKADIVVIGCQELIKLTPGEYITADTDKLLKAWEQEFLKAFNSLPNSDYILLRSLHLVALGIFVFVTQEVSPRIREVEISSIKTGLMGMAANKGGIGIRMKIDDTSLVFVTAHFAAGQSAVEERNRDYNTITDSMNFKGYRILDADMVFWLGDFNYRIDDSNSNVKRLVAAGQYADLWKNDQLIIQMANQAVFQNFQEGQLNFDPTYKYDNSSIVYDTSEKSRTPAWTDRVLFKGADIEILEYGRGEQQMSDHRPVKAFFNVAIAKVDSISSSKSIRSSVTSSIRSLSGRPAPSTDMQAWWYTHSSKEMLLGNDLNPFLAVKPVINLMD